MASAAADALQFRLFVIGSTFDIHDFMYPSRHEPPTRAPAHRKKSSAHGAVNQTIAAVCDHAACFDPPVRCTRRIDCLPATERKSCGDHLGPRPCALS